MRETRPATPSRAREKVVGALAVVVMLVTAVVAWRALRAPADVPLQLLPLASYPGNEGPPALSPDGNLVAFAWSGGAEPGPTDIYVKAVGSEALRQLTATPASETSPAWSPDGHSIAFVRDGQGVFTMSQLGGAERQVSASGTRSPGLVTRSRFSFVAGKGIPVRLASTRSSSTRSSVVG